MELFMRDIAEQVKIEGDAGKILRLPEFII